MPRELIRLLTVLLAGVTFWALANIALDTQEPWDSPGYLGFYLSALGLSAAFGYLFDHRAWRWGLIVVFAQLPVRVFTAGLGPLMIVGLGFLALEALPAIGAAAATAHLRKLQRRR